MEITYRLAQRDFYEAFLAHRKRSTIIKWLYRMLSYFLLIIIVVNLVGIFIRPNANTLTDLPPIAITAAFWAGIIWFLPWLTARNQFTKQPAAHGSKTVFIDSSGVHWRWDGGSSDVEWKTFIRIIEAKYQFLFYSSPACFNIVPKRALQPEQITAFHALRAGFGKLDRGISGNLA